VRRSTKIYSIIPQNAGPNKNPRNIQRSSLLQIPRSHVLEEINAMTGLIGCAVDDRAVDDRAIGGGGPRTSVGDCAAASMIAKLRRLALTIAICLASVPALAAELAYYGLPAGAFPHDVAPAKDGAIWYTDQHQGRLGKLDPRTGQVREIPLGRGSAPHGVVVAADAAAWITDGGQNAIARVDPATEQVRIFPLPHEFPAENLNTPAIDGRGNIWFTGQSGVYGRLDPATSKVDVWRAPKGVGPYGMTVTPSGEIWFASLAGDYIAKIETASGEATVVAPPRPGVGPRRVWSDSKGNVWASFWNSGEIAAYDPRARSWRTFPLPRSRAGCYAVYVDETDKVWASDWPANALVRLDPETGRFDTFPSDKTAANVRQLAGRPGEVWGAQSGTRRLVAVRY
jgi:virginiamycin B lyase